MKTFSPWSLWHGHFIYYMYIYFFVNIICSLLHFTYHHSNSHFCTKFTKKVTKKLHTTCNNNWQKLCKYVFVYFYILNFMQREENKSIEFFNLTPIFFFYSFLSLLCSTIKIKKTERNLRRRRKFFFETICIALNTLLLNNI